MRRAFPTVSLILVFAALHPASAGAALPSLETSILRVDVAWQPEADGALRYPTRIVFDGRAEVHSDAGGVFPTTVWGAPNVVRFSDLSPDMAPDAVARAGMRLVARPLKVRLLHDAGVPLTVREVALGTEVRFAQGVSPDLHQSGAAVAGSDAADGNVVEQFVLATGGEIVFPDRAPSGEEGTLSWERAVSVRSPKSTAADPSAKGGTLSGQIVAITDAPFLRVDGGDITRTTTAPLLRFELPDDVRPIGALAIHPVGMAGVDVDLAWVQVVPGSAQRFDLKVTGKPVEFWPQSAVRGPLREWMYRPKLMHYGARSSEGAGAAAVIDAPVPAGHEVVAMTPDGRETRLGPLPVPSTLHLENIEGVQRATLAPLAGLSPARAAGDSPAPPAPPVATVAEDGGTALRSPQLRDVMPEGIARARLIDRNGVPTVDDLQVGIGNMGDIAVPTIRIDGAATPVTRARLISPPAVLPFGVGDPSLSLYAAGFDVMMLAEVPGAIVELMIQVTHVLTRGLVYDDANLYVLSVHPTDPKGHTVDVDWYSRPGADRFAAVAEIPVEAVTENQAMSLALQASDPSSGQQLDYYNGAPHAVHSDEISGARGLYVLVADPAGPVHDPVSEVDGQPLRGTVAVYVRQTIEGPGNAYPYPRGWLSIRRHIDEPLL